MTAKPDIERIAQTIGDATRIRMLVLLTEGRALTAKELAYGAGVEPATATAHLRRLLADSLIQSREQGRHKYFRLASPEVARCVESLLTVAPAQRTEDINASPIRLARYCYDHLAGRLALDITESLTRRKLIVADSKNFSVSSRGEKWFQDFGIDLGRLARNRRKFAPLCLDWTERKDHIGGALGAEIASKLLEDGWFSRTKETRAVSLTAAGRRRLKSHFGIDWQA
ncbi:MAG TPA: winged helix-turn-helix domain-containing protein [Terriglobales bacterium]|nr:winged helix-turn-helix domain-containing protein [Terriglobales bacterium]